MIIFGRFCKCVKEAGLMKIDIILQCKCVKELESENIHLLTNFPNFGCAFLQIINTGKSLVVFVGALILFT